MLRGLGGLASGALPMALPRSGLAAGLLISHRRRNLSFVHLHTNERLSVTYWSDGRHQAAALTEINHILRDWRTGEVGIMDPDLLDLLFALKQKLGTAEPFQVISGYRSAKTNALLAGRSAGVARQSLHMDGKAIDIALSGQPLARLRRAALDLRRGGVGYYPDSGFVHVDSGRIRHWG